MKPETQAAGCRTSQPPCSDFRSPLAKGRDGFMLSQRGEELCAGATSGQYLRNRIEAAWLAGAAWGQAHPRKRPNIPLSVQKGGR